MIDIRDKHIRGVNIRWVETIRFSHLQCNTQLSPEFSLLLIPLIWLYFCVLYRNIPTTFCMCNTEVTHFWCWNSGCRCVWMLRVLKYARDWLRVDKNRFWEGFAFCHKLIAFQFNYLFYVAFLTHVYFLISSNILIWI